MYDIIDNDRLEDYIKDVKNKSDEFFKRIRITFKNGYEISIVQGEYAYSGPDTYEIALFNKNGVMDGSLFDEEDRGDDVLGWCDEEKVTKYVKKLAKKDLLAEG